MHPYRSRAHCHGVCPKCNEPSLVELPTDRLIDDKGRALRPLAETWEWCIMCGDRDVVVCLDTPLQALKRIILG